MGEKFKIGNVRPVVLEVIPAGGAVTFTFDSAEHTALVSCRAAEQDAYALFVYSGYGSGGICSNVDRICGQNTSISCEIREESADETNGFTLRNDGSADLVCTVFSLMGRDPIVESEDGGATEVS